MSRSYLLLALLLGSFAAAAVAQGNTGSRIMSVGSEGEGSGMRGDGRSSDRGTESWDTMRGGRSVDQYGGYRTEDGRYWLRRDDFYGFWDSNRIYQCYSGCSQWRTCTTPCYWWDPETASCEPSTVCLTELAASGAGRRLEENGASFAGTRGGRDSDRESFESGRDSGNREREGRTSENERDGRTGERDSRTGENERDSRRGESERDSRRGESERNSRRSESDSRTGDSNRGTNSEGRRLEETSGRDSERGSFETGRDSGNRDRDGRTGESDRDRRTGDWDSRRGESERDGRRGESERDSRTGERDSRTGESNRGNSMDGGRRLEETSGRDSDRGSFQSGRDSGNRERDGRTGESDRDRRTGDWDSRRGESERDGRRGESERDSRTGERDSRTGESDRDSRTGESGRGLEEGRRLEENSASFSGIGGGRDSDRGSFETSRDSGNSDRDGRTGDSGRDSRMRDGNSDSMSGRSESWETFSSGRSMDRDGGFRSDDGRYWQRHGESYGWWDNRMFYCESSCSNFRSCGSCEWWDSSSRTCVSSTTCGGVGPSSLGRKLLLA